MKVAGVAMFLWSVVLMIVVAMLVVGGPFAEYHADLQKMLDGVGR